MYNAEATLQCAVLHHLHRPASPPSPLTKLYIYNGKEFSDECPVKGSPSPDTNQVGPFLPPREVWSSWHGGWLTTRLTQSVKIGTWLKKRVHSILVGPGFNLACEPRIVLLSPLLVNFFALDAFEIAFDRLYSEVVE
jgi:hypothetical protein